MQIQKKENQYSQTIKAFYIFQYESNDSQFGSQYSSLNYIGCYYKGDCLRKIALIPLREIADLSEIEQILKSTANAILFILPIAPYSEQFQKLIDKIQIFLSEQTIYLPVYFTYENKELTNVVNQLKNEYNQESGTEKKNILDKLGLNKNFLHFSLNIKDPKLHNNLNLENFYGFLEVSSNNGAPNPIIAIVTYYDSFSIASDMPNGINSNGSGFIALMELIRILSKFYENYQNVIKHDILFIMTSGGNLNFEGTNQFLNSIEPGISENLQYVLCLDSLASLNDTDDLYLHLSRFPKEHEMTPNKIYKIFNTTSQNMNFNLIYNKKKVFLSNKYVPWEHEQFSKKKILSATLSSLSEASESNFNRTLITDVELDKNKLKRNIKFIAESLLAFIFDYNLNKFTIFKEEENLIDDKNVDSLINYLKKISRFPLSIEKNSRLNNDIYSFFSTYLQKVKRQSYEYTEMKFYENNSGNIKIYSVKSKMIDLYLLFLIMVYLLIIYIYTKGIKNFFIGLKGAFDSDSD